MNRLAAIVLLFLAAVCAAAQERDMERINWMEFRELDQKKADEYYRRVTDKVTTLIRDTIAKWNEAGL